MQTPDLIPKKFRTQPSTCKIKASIFWDVKKSLLIDYTPRKAMITCDNPAGLARKLCNGFKEKQREMLTKGMYLLRDCAPVHKARAPQGAARACGFVQLHQLPYRPGLTPRDYYLFRNLNSLLQSRYFEDEEFTEAPVALV